MNFKYNRVNRRRSCLICGKPDWCSYTPDGKVSFCARISNGADRVSRTGWGVFYHEKSLFGNFPIPFPDKLPKKKVELAPIEIRDFAYRKLIELSPATQSPTIINGPKGLLERKILDFNNYGFLPVNQVQRNKLAKIIRGAINRQFPEFVKTRNTALSGLPGFWIDKNGNSRLWLDNDRANPMLLIPYCDESGLIQACQIRFFGDLNYQSPRYVWLSTPIKSSGVGSGSPIHFISYSSLTSSKPLIITEGALKAATAHHFKPKFDIIANAGVTCSHSEIVKAALFRQIYFAFDNDYFENFFVASSLIKLIFDISKLSPQQNVNRISILTWNTRYRGLDDALTNQTSLESITVPRWFESLKSDFQRKLSEFADFLL